MADAALGDSHFSKCEASHAISMKNASLDRFAKDHPPVIHG
jgi:hypothetical protein